MPSPYETYKSGNPVEISSTYEGRHVTLSEGLINHPVHADGFVDGKDPVTFGATADGYGVGVAFSSAAAATDLIAIDTEGIWALSVVAVDDEGNSAVQIGDIIFINRTTCILSKISSDTTNLVFGYALDTLASGTTDVIAVKVHWDPWYDIYRDYAADGAAEDALLIDVDDASTLSTGYQQGLQNTFSATGAMTGDAERHNYAADMFLADTADTPYVYNYTAYVEVTGDPTLDQVAAYSAYIPDMGDSCANITVIDLGLAGGDNSPAGRHTFMRCRNHTAGQPPDATFQLEGSPHSDYLFSFQYRAVLPMVEAAVGGAQTHKIRVRAQGTDYFIPLHTA